LCQNKCIETKIKIQNKVKKFKNKIMSRYFLQLLLFAVFIIPTTSLNATHIVGGRIGYNCLGGDQYEIVLSIYRDCYNGDQQAPFDDPAYVAIYDQSGVLVDNISMPLMEDDTLTSFITDPCLVIIQEVCVHTTTYRKVVTLPFLTGGYTLAYQRCCRNITINNIIDPVATGATFDIKLSELSMQDCNSSPEFINYPAIYICADQPLDFDHSAIDVDGDSLVYSLCIPNSGGSLSTPQPIPASPPPYDLVFWANGYSTDNMLGLGAPLTIDPVTGQLTATPGITGQFVVGVCVTEYDPITGQELSKVRRDFQYNVVICGEKAAAIAAPAAQCDDLSVDIENQSTNSTAYEWCFDYPNCGPGTVSTTTDLNFTWGFPDTGTYVIQLIAEPNSICADTFYHEIYLQNNSLEANYQVEVFECDGFASLDLMDLSEDFVSPPDEWLWEISYGDPLVTQVSTLQNPMLEVPLGITGTIDFTVTSENGCVQTLTQNFVTESTNPGDVILSDIDACFGDTAVPLNADSPGYPEYSYSWAPANLLSGANTENPSVIEVTGNQIFSVTITPPNNACEIIREVNVTAVDLPVLDFSTFLECDGVTLSFTNLSLNVDPTALEWNFGDPASGANNTSTEENPSHAYPGVGVYQVTLNVADTELCTDMIMMNVIINDANLDAAFDIKYVSSTCSEDSVVVQLIDLSVNSTASPIDTWEWIIDPPGVTLSGPNPSYTFYGSQTVDITLTVTTADGCNSISTQQNVEITIVEDEDQFPDSLTVCNGGSTQLLPGGSPEYTYQWSPTTGLNDPTSPSPTFFPTETTTYTVVVSHIGIDICEAEEEVVVFVTPAINLDIDGDGVLCTDQAMLTATTDVDAVITWLDNPSNNILASGPDYNFTVTGIHNITVRAEDEYGCIDEETIIVRYDPVDVAIPDTAAVCLGDQLIVCATNLDPGNILTYSWTPIELFVPGTTNSACPDIIETIGEQTIYVDIVNQYGCTYTDSVIIAVIDPNVSLSFTTEVQCDGSTVEFTNTSTDAFGYVWNFGDGSGPSYEDDPEFTYNYGMSGEFIVTLDLVYDVDCLTPAVDTITTIDPTVTADFTYGIVECSQDSAVIAFFDQSVSTFTIVNWEWQPFGSIDQNTLATFYTEGEVDVTLTITTSNGCMSSITQTIDIQFAELTLADSITMCKGDTTQLNPGGDPTQTYSWTPTETLDNPTSVNPSAFPTETTIYTVEVYAVGSDTCAYTEQVTVFVPADINIDLGDDIITCGENVTITPTSDVDVDIEWISVLNGPIGENQTVTVNPFTTDTIIAIATDQYGCIDSDTIVVTDNGVDISEIPLNMTACSSIDTFITLTNLDIDDVLTYQWTPLEYIVSGADEETVVVNVPEGCVTFSCLITNQNNCTETVMTTICVVPFNYQIPDTVYVCPNTPQGINPGGDPSYSYTWSPGDNLSATNVANPIFTSNVAGTYNYSATIFDNSGGIGCATTEDVTVIVYPLLELETGGDTTLCEISTVPLTAETVTSSVINWYNEGGTQIDTGSPISVTPVEGTNTYTAIATDSATGCMDTSTVVVQVNILNIETVPDSIIYVCSGVPTPINPEGDPLLIYEWNPDTNLDLTEPWNPIATTEDTLEIEVTITDPAGNCFLIRNITVIPYPLILPVASPDTAIVCELSPAELTVSSTEDAEYIWFSDADMMDQIGTGDTIIVDPASPQFFYVMATDEFGCSEKDSAFVMRYPSLNLQGFGDSTLCEISTIPIWATSAEDVTIEWFTDLSEPSFDSGDTIFVTSVEGTNLYYAVATDIVTGCLDTTDVTVQVNVLEQGIPDTIVYVCSGVPTTINNGGYPLVIYEWIPDSNIVVIPPWNPTVTTTDTIVYELTITDTIGMCYLETTVTVIPYPLIQPIASPDTTFLCELDEAELTVTSVDTVDAEYIWYSDAAMLDSIGSGSTITVDPDSTQYYYVTAFDENGCSEKDSALVVRFPSLNLETFGDTIICAVATIPLWATTTEDAAIEWYTDLGEPSIDNGYNIFVTPEEGSNTYYAVATDIITGCKDTADVLVQVNLLDIEGIPDSLIYVCPNIPTQILAGNPNLIYTWECDPEIDASVPWNPVVTTNDTIICMVTIEDPAGMCYLEIPVTIIAYPELNPVITPPTVALCELDDVELTVSADVFPVDYMWFSDSLMTDLIGTNSTVTVDPDDSQYFYVKVTDEFGCFEIESVEVIRNPSINLETAGDTTLCEITTVPLTAWTDLGTTVITWYQGDPLTEFDSGSPIEVLPEEGTNTYTAIALDTITGCLDTSAVVVQVNPLNIDDIPDTPIYVCPNVPTVFFVGNPDLEYIWNCDPMIDASDPWNPVVTTNDTVECIVTIVDELGMCYLEVPVTIIAYPEINPVISQDTIVCTFDSLTLTVSSNVEPVEYVWFSDPEMTEEIGQGESVIVTPSGTVMYFVMATDEFGCFEKDTVTINAYPIQAALIALDPIVCEDLESGVLTAFNYGPEEIVSYVWSPSDLITTTNADSIVIGTLTGTNNPFCVELTNEYGCIETVCDTITMINLMDSLTIVALPDTILLDDSSIITVEGCTFCDYSWEWETGDIEPDDTPVITATPSEPGDNIYEVYATLLGCEQNLATSVYVIDKVCDENYVFLPTAFSPNNDGFNDVLELRCFYKDELDIEIMIYNRWGEEIVRSTNPFFQWDGTYKGEELAPDVYGFYLRVNCPGVEEPLIQKGSITLLR
jgi:gliding motility-associated-like protein